MSKTAATSPLNRSGRLCEWFCESEEAGWTILWSRKENQIRLKVEGGKKNFFLKKYGAENNKLDQTKATRPTPELFEWSILLVALEAKSLSFFFSSERLEAKCLDHWVVAPLLFWT